MPEMQERLGYFLLRRGYISMKGLFILLQHANFGTLFLNATTGFCNLKCSKFPIFKLLKKNDNRNVDDLVQKVKGCLFAVKSRLKKLSMYLK